jgi:hypothetical protein
MKTVTESTVKGNRKPTNRTYLDIRATVKQKRSKAQHLSERLNNRNRTKSRLVDLLKSLGEVDLSKRVDLCAAKFSVLTCGEHIAQRKPHDKCNFRLCPHCAARRSRKVIEKYLPRAVAFMSQSSVRVSPVHLVLTLQHRAGEPVEKARKRLMDAFKRLTRRKFWSEHFLGGLYAVEFTLGTDNAWHCHAHLLAFRIRWFDVALLKSEWLTITGDSHVLRLDLIDDLSSGLGEVVKYLSKPLDIERFDKRHLSQFLMMAGKKMLGAFGEFMTFCRNYKPSESETAKLTDKQPDYYEGDCCPSCQKPLFEVPLSVVDLIAFVRRIEARTVPKPKLTELKL